MYRGEESYIENFSGEARWKEGNLCGEKQNTQHDYKINKDILSDIKINLFVKKNSKLHK